LTEPLTIAEGYRAFATPTQSRYMDAVNEHGGYRAAGRALFGPEDNGSNICASMNRLKAKAALMGYAPEQDFVDPVPLGFKLKRHSQYYDKEGKAAGRWVIATPDDETQALAMRAAFEAMSQELPRLAPLEGPRLTLASLLNLYTLTDCHVGMLAWRHEGGADWDLKIAEDILFRCFEQMILAAPDAETGVVNQLGDFLHTDGMVPMTPTGHNVLDADGRYSKMVGIAVRLLRRVVDLALMKHERVIVLLAEGNHDMGSSIWLRIMFKALYENDPRVEVIESALPYYALEHGKTMLGFHHGHLKKPDSLTPLMAAQFAPIWGRTTHRYAHMGHIHELYEREHSGMIVTQHPTLAARDAYAARGGWFGDRAASVITYHDEFGQVAKNTVVPEMLR